MADEEQQHGTTETREPEAVEPEPETVPDPEEQEPTVDAWDSERALAKIKKANAEAKALRERAKEAESELEVTKAELAAAQADRLRQKVAHTYGLDPLLAARLRGDTEEALQEDAQTLLEVVQAGQRQARQRQAPFVPHADPSAMADRDIDAMVFGLL